MQCTGDSAVGIAPWVYVPLEALICTHGETDDDRAGRGAPGARQACPRRRDHTVDRRGSVAARGRGRGGRIGAARGGAAPLPADAEHPPRPRRIGVGGYVALTGWVLDKSAAARADDPMIGAQLTELAGGLFVCPVGELEQLYSARSAVDYDARRSMLHASFEVVSVPPDLFDRALRL